MTKRSDFRGTLRVLTAVLCMGLFAPAVAWGMVINRIVATIDGDPVTLYELKQFARKTIRGRDITAQDRAGLLDALVLNTIIAKESKAQGLDVPESEVDIYIQDVMARNKLDEMQLRQALEAQGIAYEAYREQIRAEVQRQRLIAREIRGKVNISPEEIERYYQANLEEYARPAQVRVAQIIFLLPPDASPAAVDAAKAKADEVYAKTRRGDFAELAEQYSDDGGADGGMLGWFKPGELVDSLDEAVQGLKVGEVSAPVRGPQGFHLLKVVERQTDSYQPLEEHADEIKEKLYAAALESRYERWIGEELRKRHHVELR